MTVKIVSGRWKQHLPEIPATRFSCATSGSFRPKLGLFILSVVLIASVCFFLVPAVRQQQGAASSSSRMSASEEQVATITHKESVAAVSKANDDFTGRLYGHLVSETGDAKNMVASPFSISAVVAMAYAGARQNTASQMKKSMAFPDKDKVLLEGYEDVLKVLKSNENFTLEAANKLFVQNNYKLLDDYLALMKAHYKATPESVNFAESEEARKLINQWVEDQTNKKIVELLPSGVITALTRIVLVNAVYFKGDWKSKFSATDTKKQEFTTLAGTKVQVDMMHKTAEYRGTRIKELDCAVLEFPYKGDRLSMLVFLSQKPEGFKAMEEKFATLDIVGLKTGGQFKFEVSLPKFKLESSHDLKGGLQAIGMTDMFSMDAADFSGITGTKDLFVSAVMQKAFIEVNEEGSEAAAATGMVMMMRSMPAPPQKFTCDRPFLFAIKDNLTGMVLFRGRVVDPTQ